MKNKIVRIFVLVCALMMLLPMVASAAIPYSASIYVRKTK